MPKFMNSRYFFSKLDLQLFADAGGDDAGDDAGDGDDQDDDDDGSDEGGEGERKYTQADLDKAVARTIAKERSKAERAAKRKEKQSSSGDKDKDDGESEDARARKEAEGKASRLEVKVACFEAGVDKDSVDDVAALAHSYMDADEDLDLEDAIEKMNSGFSKEYKPQPENVKAYADIYEKYIKLGSFTEKELFNK